MKYVMTDEGTKEFKGNRQKYRVPNTYNKVMGVLSSGVGYNVDSLLNFIISDPRVKEGPSYLAKALMELEELGYVKAIGKDQVTPMNFRRGDTQ